MKASTHFAFLNNAGRFYVNPKLARKRMASALLARLVCSAVVGLTRATFQRDILRRHLGVRALHAQPGSPVSTRRSEDHGRDFSPWPQLKPDKVRGPIIHMSSDLELASSPRPVFFRLPRRLFLPVHRRAAQCWPLCRCNPANPLPWASRNCLGRASLSMWGMPG
jgi:hypothetical protein